MRTLNKSLALALLAALFACKKPASSSQPGTETAVAASQAQEVEAPKAIAAFTSGEISRNALIRVRLTEPVGRGKDASDVPAGILSFEPEIEGELLWSMEDTLDFRPAGPLPSGQRYEATLALKKLLPKSGEEHFVFGFSVIRQRMDVRIVGLEALADGDGKVQTLSGTVSTADDADPKLVAQALSVSLDGKAQKVQWPGSKDAQARTFDFKVKALKRDEADLPIIIKWEGKALGTADEGRLERTLPGLSNFIVTQVRAIDGDDKHVEIRFSDPLKPKQKFDGLVSVGRRNDLRFRAKSNVLKVYGQNPWQGTYPILVSQGVRNTMNYRLKHRYSGNISFELLKPEIRFAGKSNIVPSTDGLTVPFEAANIRALTVEAIRIPLDNVPQFFQVNQLDGSRELRRVGRTVWKDHIALTASETPSNSMQRYGLDLSPLVKLDRAGIYRIKISFGLQDVLYQCANTPEDTGARSGAASEGAWDQSQDTPESSYWDYYEDEYDNGDDNPYRNRTNPCHRGYFQYNRGKVSAEQNFLLTDIGLIAKTGADGTLVASTTDLKTGEPLAGVEVQVLNYQQEEVVKTKTDSNGLARAQGLENPFLVIARHGGQSSFLKLDRGQSLSTSHFDVSGQKTRKGIKGTIYAERGIWRPGDTIYLMFVLQDLDNNIPEDHPVKLNVFGPRGQRVFTKTRTGSLGGFYDFRFHTSGDAPTGDYRAEISVGGATFHKNLKVETVRPNRLKIGLDFGKTLLEGSEKISATLSSTWLHGAPASYLTSDIEVTLNPTGTSFNRFTDYAFDDPSRTFRPETDMIFEGNLNESGEAKVSATIDARGKSPGMLNAKFRTRVFESGGAASVDRFNIKYSPYKRYVGIKTPKGDKARGMLLTDIKHTVDVVGVNAEGKATGSGEVEMRLYKIKWRWWWEKGPETLANYVGSSSYQPLRKGSVDLKDGVGKWQFEVNYPDWGRYLITAEDKQSGHRTGKIVYIDWPGWAGRAQKDNPGGASVLLFAADKSEYNVGETVHLDIPTGASGRALVSLETGSKVLKAEWINVQENRTRYSFKTEPSMAPNIYAHVTYVQPQAKSDNDRPIRVYGVVPITVQDPKTKLEPTLETPASFEPSSKASVTVAEKEGRAMNYTLAVVDEGLLGLTRFKTPKLWDHFYQREALGVRTWDVFDRVAGAYGGALEKLLAIGGDDEGEGAKEGEKANRFPPMVRFYGPFALAAGEKAKHDIDFPAYIGAVRVMVVAGANGAYGSVGKEVTVKKPLMLLGTAPRVMGPDETAKIPVSVFALDEKIKNVSVTLKASGALSLVGKNSRTLNFKGPGDMLTAFEVKADGVLGIGKLELVATGGKEKAVQTIELDVRPSASRVRDIYASSLAKGESWSPVVKAVGMAQTRETRLEVSNIPPLNLGSRLQYLMRYPHGCVEQTTSAAFPQVYLSRVVELLDEEKDKIQTNVAAGIDRLRTYQTSSGGFGYWPGNPRPQDWTTSYVGHFLLEARAAGFAVPNDMLQNWKNYQTMAANGAQSGGAERADLTQAYRLYTLALAGNPQLGAMNRLRERDSLSTQARWRLAAAYELSGQHEAAEKLIHNAGTSIDSYTELANTYGSDTRDRAMILETLVLMKKDGPAAALAQELSKTLSAGSYSTHTISYALIALAKFGAENFSGEPLLFSYQWQGKEHQVKSLKPVMEIVLPQGKDGAMDLKVKNTGDKKLSVRVVESGIPKAGGEDSAQNGLAVSVEYRTLEGDRLSPDLNQGTDFLAKVTVANRSGRDLDEIALSHLVPAGWEIRNLRLDGNSNVEQGAYEYQDVRDDRVYTYFDLKRGESRTIVVQLHASYVGKYYLPLVAAATMYDERINGRTKGQWIVVTAPGDDLASAK